MEFPMFIYIFSETTGEFLTKKKIETLEAYNRVKDLPNVTKIPPPMEMDGYYVKFSGAGWLYEKNIF